MTTNNFAYNGTTGNVTGFLLDICDEGALGGFNQGYFAPMATPSEWYWPVAVRGFV